MTQQELTNKKIGVLGFGIEGQAVTRWLLAQNIVPVIFDEKPFELWPEKDATFAKDNKLNIISGESYLDRLNEIEVAFRSPGLHRLNPKLVQAEENGLIITSQTKWFLENCPATVVGITGTKGKGTTSSLIYEIIKRALETKSYGSDSILNDNSKVYLTGNIGKTQPFEILNSLTEKDFVVYELSSFQLQDITKSPKFAVVLMITQDHLDQHKDIKEYHLAKQNIVAHQTLEDYAIINADYPASKEFSNHTPAKVAWISRQSKPEKGAFILENGGVDIFGFSEDITKPFVSLSELKLRGMHNLENISAATLVGLQMGVESKSIKDSLTEFTGLEHRLQLVGTLDGVSYYNDSFSTVPETTIAAIKSFTEPSIFIIGGSEKQSNFNELAKTIVSTSNLKALVIIGQTTQRISDAIKNAGGFNGKTFTGAQSMNEIFEQVAKVAESGDVVVLSPACASFGMFENYRDRGHQFAQKVKELGGTL